MSITQVGLKHESLALHGVVGGVAYGRVAHSFQGVEATTSLQELCGAFHTR